MKVGIIGTGLQGGRRAQPMKQFGDELSMVADVQKNRATLLADRMGCEATDDWEKVVSRKDIEAVIVCTPPHLHKPMCLEALKRGKHVLCEKPLARNPEEAKEIVTMAEKNKVVLKCGFNLRHHSGLQQARIWFDQGIIGELRSVNDLIR